MCGPIAVAVGLLSGWLNGCRCHLHPFNCQTFSTVNDNRRRRMRTWRAMSSAKSTVLFFSFFKKVNVPTLTVNFASENKS